MVIEIDHNTALYVPTLYELCVGSLAPRRFQMSKGLWEGAYVLSSLFKKSSKSNCFQILLQKKFFPNCLKNLGVGPSQGFTPAPPSRQDGAHSVGLIGRRLTDHDHSLGRPFKIFLCTSLSKATT